MARRYSAISGQSCTYQGLPSHGYTRDDTFIVADDALIDLDPLLRSDYRVLM